MKILNILVNFGSLASLASAFPGTGQHGPRLPQLPKGAFDLVGFGKNNPIGSVTGGKGGPTTTITDTAALATAVRVGLLFPAFIKSH